VLRTAGRARERRSEGGVVGIHRIDSLRFAILPGRPPGGCEGAPSRAEPCLGSVAGGIPRHRLIFSGLGSCSDFPLYLNDSNRSDLAAQGIVAIHSVIAGPHENPPDL
jgi:hypothetical protein